MTNFAFWIGTVLVAGWLALLVLAVALLWLGYRMAAAADEEPGEEFAGTYLATFEAMRDAIATARRETAPGEPSADLVACWAIWPEAPLAAEQDDTA